MSVRNRFFPRSKLDFCCFLTMIVFVPITFAFEFLVVLPAFHDTNGLVYKLELLLGLFLVFNVLGNMVGCMIVDTSINSVMLLVPNEVRYIQFWRFCDTCETIAPPRSWHCNTCGTCILKRDHHCAFAGYCIGHYNHRYFVFFLLYVAIGATITTVYNSLYFWWLLAPTYVNTITFMKMFLPMIMACIDITWDSFYVVIYILNCITSAFSVILIIFHAPFILRGAKDCEKNAGKYNLGLYRNLEMVLGKRMYLTWLSPLIRSELPHDGIYWESLMDGNGKDR